MHITIIICHYRQTIHFVELDKIIEVIAIMTAGSSWGSIVVEVELGWMCVNNKVIK